MKLSAETNWLIQKKLRQTLTVYEIGGCAVISTLAFVGAYAGMSTSLWHDSPALSYVLLLLIATAAALATAKAVTRYLNRASSRTWLVTSISLWLGLAAGSVIGHQYWYMGLANYYGWKAMASYVDINPSLDQAQPYMDAGVIYFKEQSAVLGSKALAFRNGATYCVAPIYLDPLLNLSSTSIANTQATSAGFIIPRAGEVDFWAVGKDCCGTNGSPFACSDVGKIRARSGLRVLDRQSQLMYELAVQEYSATTGLPARNPMFLHWVVDPFVEMDKYANLAIDSIWVNMTLYFFAASFCSYALHLVLRHWKWQ